MSCFVRCRCARGEGRYVPRSISLVVSLVATLARPVAKLFLPHLLHWNPFPLPSDFIADPQTTHRGLTLTALCETSRASIFSMLTTTGFLDDALLTPPETLTESPGTKRRAIRLRSPEGS